MKTKKTISPVTEAAQAIDKIEATRAAEESAVASVRAKFSAKRSAIVANLSEEAGELFAKLSKN